MLMPIHGVKLFAQCYTRGKVYAHCYNGLKLYAQYYS